MSKMKVQTEIKELLRQFQAGYAERNIEKVDSFVEELFIKDDSVCILGTGTGELFLGAEKVKELVRNDWEYWNDVLIDCENVHISIDGNVAWFVTSGTVKYTFEHTQQRYDSYIGFIKAKAEDPKLTPKQRIAFINWVLALTYHQREDIKRECFWPLCLSGVLTNGSGKWRIAQLQFSIPKADYPDERFESSGEYLESYNSQNSIVDGYQYNQMTAEIKALLNVLETELMGQKAVSEELVGRHFTTDREPCIIGWEKQWYYGKEQIMAFFAGHADFKLSFDMEHAIAVKSGNTAWITATGTLKQSQAEDQLYLNTLEDLGRVFEAEGKTSTEKLFEAHRSIAYAMKESASGVDYTWPIRMTAVIAEGHDGPAFQQLHFSFPFCWVLEGKLDGV